MITSPDMQGGFLADRDYPASDPKFRTDKRDWIIMTAMVLLYLLLALYNLGSFNVPETSWQPLHRESLIFELGREVRLGRIYYYSGINESRYGDARFTVLYEEKGKGFRPLATIEKNDCEIWKYRTVDAMTSRLQIIADPPGGTLNEIALVEKGTRTPLSGITVVGGNKSAGRGRADNLLDEQRTFEYAPSYMTGFYFDEIYHGRTAFEQLQRMEQYENTHPPLGKLLIASGIAVFGMNPFGWRITGTLFGAALIPAMYLFGKKLFGSSFFAFCAAFLMMVDFMHFTQSRAALIDVYAVFFVILMYYFMCDYFANTLRINGVKHYLVPLCLCGISLGLGAASKWIALYAAVGIGFLLLIRVSEDYREHRRMHGGDLRYLSPPAALILLFFVLVPLAIYTLSYIPFLLVPSPGHEFIDILKNQRDMFRYHSELKATHPFSSPWWSWPLDLRPVWLYMGEDLPRGQVSSIASFGNPAIWWEGIPSIMAASVIAFARRDRRMAVVLTGAACQYVPWMTIPRLAFIYHFFSVVPFMILSQVYVMQAATDRYPRARYAVYAYLCLVALLFIIFYPLLSGLQVPEGYIDRLRWLKTWVF